MEGESHRIGGFFKGIINALARRKEVSIPLESPTPLKKVLLEIGKPNPDFRQFMLNLFDFSIALLQGTPGAEVATRDRQEWLRVTGGGSNLQGATYGGPEANQQQAETILRLQLGKGHTFYVPGGNGIIRVVFRVGDNGETEAELDRRGLEDTPIKENFINLGGQLIS